MTHPARLAPLLVALSLAVGPRPSDAQWTTDGVALCTEANNQRDPTIVSDGAGGAIVTWYDHRNGLADSDIYAQRVNAAGVPQWTAGGVALCAAASYQLDPTIVSDGAGGAIVTWYDYRSESNYDIYAQRVLASGAVDPAWPADGRALCTAGNHQVYPTIVTDSAGGAIVTWQDKLSGTGASNIYAQRVDAAGVPQWTANGVPLCNAASSQVYPTIAVDGAGGAIVTWRDHRGGLATSTDIYAQRVDAVGVTQWTANGVPLCDAANNQWDPTIAADGAGGAIVTWPDYRNDVTNSVIYAQRVNAAGVPQWADEGVALSTIAGEQVTPKIVTGSAGAAIVTWSVTGGGSTNNGVYAQLVNAAGVPQWTADGVRLRAAVGLTPTIATDGAGGAIITWEDNLSSPTTHDIYAQRVNAAGVPQWTPDGVALCAAANWQYVPEIVSDGAGGAIVTWYDERSGNTNSDIYAQRIHAGGGVVAVSPGGPERFAVRAPHPNPARVGTTISFDLSAAQRVSVGVYDVAGKLVRTLAVGREFPAGSPSLVWNGASDSGAPARAGIYFVRVTVDGASVARRVAILR